MGEGTRLFYAISFNAVITRLDERSTLKKFESTYLEEHLIILSLSQEKIYWVIICLKIFFTVYQDRNEKS